MARRDQLENEAGVGAIPAVGGSTALDSQLPGRPTAAAFDSRPGELDDDVRYHLLKLVEDRPEITQREAAEALGVSLGKANYCFRALIRKGLIKARNFRNSKRKIAYAYLLTPQGIEEKMRVTRRFLERKLREYDTLVAELRELTTEVNEQRRANGEPEVEWMPRGGEK